MELQKIKKNIDVIKKLEKSSQKLFESLSDNKRTNFSLMNMMTFSLTGVTLGVSLSSGSIATIPLLIAIGSAGLWAYLTNTDDHITGDIFDKYVGKKFKKISNSNSMLSIYKSNLTDLEIELLNEIYEKKIEPKNLLINLIFNSVDKEYIEKNAEEFFEFVNKIEFKDEKEEELFKTKLIDTVHLCLVDNKDDTFEDIKKQVNKNQLHKQIIIKKEDNPQKMILKSI